MEGEGPFRKGNAKEGRKAKPTQKASPISQTCPIRVVCKINHTAASPASLETPRFSDTDRSHAVIQLLGRNFSPIHDRSAAAASSSFHCSSFFFLFFSYLRPSSRSNRTQRDIPSGCIVEVRFASKPCDRIGRPCLEPVYFRMTLDLESWDRIQGNGKQK